MAQHRGRALQFSNFSDATGSEIFDLTIMMVAVATLGLTVGQLGILNALGTVSFLLLAVPLGAVVDHVGPWRILLLSLTCKTFLIALGTALYLTGHLTPVAVMVLVTLFGIVVVATENSQVSIVPLIMGDNDDAAGIVSLMSSADRLARIAAPAVVGLLVARGHALIALAIAIGMLTVAVLTALLLRPDRPTIDSSETSSEGDGSSSDSETAEVASGTKFARLRHQLTHGFHVIWENKVLRAVVLLVTAGNMGLAISDSTLSILILRELALGPAFFGMLGTIAAVSGLVGAAIAPKITKTSALWNIFLVSSSVQFVLALLPLVALMFPATARPLFIVFDALWGLSMTLSNISGGAYTVAAVNSESLGRTTAAYRTVTMGSVPVAAILGGFLADTCGLIVPLIIWPAMLGVATLVFFLGTVRYRQMEQPA